jgi:hypothetical protein
MISMRYQNLHRWARVRVNSAIKRISPGNALGHMGGPGRRLPGTAARGKHPAGRQIASAVLEGRRLSQIEGEEAPRFSIRY